MPSCRVAGSTAAEKQTIKRGLTLNPSSWFSKAELLQTLGLEEGSQTLLEDGKIHPQASALSGVCHGRDVTREGAHSERSGLI